MRLLIGILFLVIGMAASAQPPHKFYSAYGSNGYDVGYDVKQTLDGGYIIVGSTSSYGQGNTDMYLLKLDSMGQFKFQSTFGGVSNEIGKSIVQLADSSFVMTGYTSSTGVGGYDVFLVKADKTGNLVWQKTIGGADWDFAYSLQATSDGGFIIGGTTYSYGHGNADGYIIKTDANGDTLWTKTYGGLKDDEFKSVIQTADLNYALTGYTKSYNDSLGDVWVLKINQSGDTLSRKFYGGNKEDFGNDIIEHPNGDFFVVGGTESFGVGKVDGYAIKIDNSGNQINHQEHGTVSNDEEFRSVVISKRNSNLIGFIEKEFFVGYNLQVRLIEWTTNLGYYFATGYGSILDDEIYKIVVTKDNGYACIGYSAGFNSVNKDVYLLKTDSTLIGSPSIVGVAEYQKINNKVDIFPNPTSKEININTAVEIKNVKLYDAFGIELNIQKNIIYNSNKNITIDIQNLNDGIYFIDVNSNKIEKIIINH